MPRAKHRIIATLLGALTLLIALYAGSARAETGAKWLVLTSGEAVKTAEELPVTLKGELPAGSKLILIAKFAGVKDEVSCTAAELIGMKLEGEGSIPAGGKLKLAGCKIFLNGAESKPCEPHTKGAPAGTLETTKLRGDLGLHPLKNEKGEVIALHGPIRIEPEVGLKLVIVLMGEECAMGEEGLIAGTLYFKDSEGSIETHRVKHSIEEGPGSSVLMFGEKAENLVHIAGSMLLSLGGTHSGLKWSGMIG